MQPGKYYAAAAEAADILPGVERLSQPGGRAAEELIAFVSLCDEVWRQIPMIFPVIVMCAIARWGTVRSVRVRRSGHHRRRYLLLPDGQLRRLPRKGVIDGERGSRRTADMAGRELDRQDARLYNMLERG